MTWPAPITLIGKTCSLVPLELSHTTDLAQKSGDLHRLWYTFVPRPEQMQANIETRLGKQHAGEMTPFTICDADGMPIGMTTYMRPDPVNRRVEIGSTWLSKDVQRSGINTETKLLLLQHAFEQLDCIAVEFRTHRLNTQSRTAIERLGAQLDGILRAHETLPNGTIRDTAVYSITAPEWPAVKAGLLGKINR